MPPPAAPVLRRGATTGEHAPSAPALLALGLVLGLVGGWVAGLVRVRMPSSPT